MSHSLCDFVFFCPPESTALPVPLQYRPRTSRLPTSLSNVEGWTKTLLSQISSSVKIGDIMLPVSHNEVPFVLSWSLINAMACGCVVRPGRVHSRVEKLFRARRAAPARGFPYAPGPSGSLSRLRPGRRDSAIHEPDMSPTRQRGPRWRVGLTCSRVGSRPKFEAFFLT